MYITTDFFVSTVKDQRKHKGIDPESGNMIQI